VRATLSVRLLVLALLGGFPAFAAAGDVAVRGETVHTSAGAAISDGVVIVRNGKIAQVGPASQVAIPESMRVLRARVVTPGLVDAHTVVGLAGYLNQAHDQDQVERTAPVQPELRAIDAYDPQERLVSWVRRFGVTTMHTGHGPGALISGQTMVVKTRGATVEAATVTPAAMVAATLGDSARGADNKSPGSRAKMVAMLRAELVAAQEYLKKLEAPEKGKEPPRSLKLEMLGKVLKGEMPLLVTAHRARDIQSALRVADEFKIKLVLDGGAEAYLVADEIKRAGVPVIVHPTMARSNGETENLSFETASKLKQAGVAIALQSGFEGYVPKTRVLLFEAAVGAAHGLGPDGALLASTIDAAKILGLDKRLGSLEVGKDGDLALYDGDPFEYTTHCVGVVIEGDVVEEGPDS
jgi:imidazolonepropionase-like amidohydrolase